MDSWFKIPEGFEPLVHDHIRRTRGDDALAAATENDNLLSAYDFPAKQAVQLEFPDGSFAQFLHAFYVKDARRELVAVFTEHCGYHVFSAVDLQVSHVLGDDLPGRR